MTLTPSSLVLPLKFIGCPLACAPIYLLKHDLDCQLLTYATPVGMTQQAVSQATPTESTLTTRPDAVTVLPCTTTTRMFIDTTEHQGTLAAMLQVREAI